MEMQQQVGLLPNARIVSSRIGITVSVFRATPRGVIDCSGHETEA